MYVFINNGYPPFLRNEGTIKCPADRHMNGRCLHIRSYTGETGNSVTIITEN